MVEMSINGSDMIKNQYGGQGDLEKVNNKLNFLID